MFLKLPHYLATAALSIGAGMLIFSQPAQAQYPDKTIRLVVPFAPGGGTDLIARPLAAEMSKELGQSVIVDNKAGAGTIIGTDNVARSPADGYSILVASFAHVVNPLIHQSVPYKDNSAFAPVMLVGLGPNVLVVPEDSPFHSLEELIAGAKAHPGKLAYASQGAGTSAHLAGELFVQEAGLEVTHIAYRGAAPALADVMGGVVQYMFATAASAKPYISNGKLRALAVTTAEESEAFPGVPSIQQQLPGVQVQSWYGLYVPAGTPAEVIARINEAANKATASELMQKGAKTEGVRIVAGTPEALAAFEKAETERWSQFLLKNKIQIN